MKQKKQVPNRAQRGRACFFCEPLRARCARDRIGSDYPLNVIQCDLVSASLRRAALRSSSTLRRVAALRSYVSTLFPFGDEDVRDSKSINH